VGYNTEALQHLLQLLRRVPRNGSLLELGAQHINATVPRDVLNSTLHTIHGAKIPLLTAGNFDLPGPWRVGELFRGSCYHYRCIDLYPGDFTIVADLNTFEVDDKDRGSFHLITNQGTSEHVADQINCFRVVHDYAAIGATMYHAVPFTGYYNHGLYNYHPLFFVFMAHANQYELEWLSLTEAHLPHTIPKASCIGADAWSMIPIHSGLVVVMLRKLFDAPFKIFTDFDQIEMGSLDIKEPWATMIRERYDLRVRT
jgi:hypothetical protein